MLEKFLQAIHEKRYLSVDFIAKEDGLLRNRKCVPFDYGESRKYKDNQDRFHFLDLNNSQWEDDFQSILSSLNKPSSLLRSVHQVPSFLE